ncbi:Amino acid permease 8 [Linum perenne]
MVVESISPIKAFEFDSYDSETDDDGRPKRKGTMMTASAHIITSVIGSGVLSLAWATAQLGWIAGPVMLFVFALITWYTARMLCDCYRCPGPHFGTRTYTYTGAVKAHLGGTRAKLCGVAQFIYLLGTTIGYTIATPISMAAIQRSGCFHKHGHQAGCHTSNNKFVIIFGIIQIMLSQLPNFHELAFISVIAAVMSFAYSIIGLGLCISIIIKNNVHGSTGLTGVKIGEGGMTRSMKVFDVLQAVGDIAFAYSYAPILLEIEDTLKSSPPENDTMKKASGMGIAVTTGFYGLCGVLGYAAFGNEAPGNLLTGFGFYDPFWLVDIANLFVVIHLIGAYQVFIQPTFQIVEEWCKKKWPDSGFLRNEYPIGMGKFKVNPFRLIWRTIYVIGTCVIGMLFPFFNSVLGLLGAMAFWPLTLYFPIEMYKKQAGIEKYSSTWIWVTILSGLCLIVSILSAIGSVDGIITSLEKYKPFQFTT